MFPSSNCSLINSNGVCTALWKEELQAARGILLSHDKMEVNLDMYSTKAREGAVSALKEGFSCKKSNDIMGVTGSFRKLEVD
jgi:hypothetical protein